jgi:hypothetical protein
MKAHIPVVFGFLDALSVLPLNADDLSFLLDTSVKLGEFLPYLIRSIPERLKLIERNGNWMTKNPNIKDYLLSMLQLAKDGKMEF